MSSRQKPNEWADIIAAQSLANMKHENQERSLSNLNKQLYKAELESQFKEKQLQKEKERKMQELESQFIVGQANDYHSYQEKLKNDKKGLQSLLSQEYTGNISQKVSQLRNEAETQRKIERNIIENVKSDLENYQLDKKMLKKNVISAEKQFLLEKNRIKESVNMEKEIEKKVDRDLIQLNIDKANKREQDYREFLRKLEDQSELKKKAYEPVFDSMANQAKKHEVVLMWEKEAEKKQQTKELQELQKKLDLKRQIAEGLKQQLYEKTLKNEAKVADFNIEKQMVDTTAQNYHSYIEKSKNESKSAQKSYYSFLESQKLQKDQEKLQENLLSTKERTLNSDILKKIEKNEEVEFNSIPGIHPRRSPLEVTFKRAHNSVSRFANDLSGHQRIVSQGNILTPVIIPAKEARLNSFSSFDDEKYKHNPITNPIGTSQVIRSSALRGRGLQSLQTGNIFIQ